MLDRVVADGRYGVRLGQIAGGRRGGAAARDRRRRRRRTRSCATIRRRSRSPAAGSARPGCPSDHPLPVGLADAAEAVTGRRPALLGEPYGADMQMFVNDGGTPCVIFGPGDVKVAHSADEYVPLDEVEACARVLADVGRCASSGSAPAEAGGRSGGRSRRGRRSPRR